MTDTPTYQCTFVITVNAIENHCGADQATLWGRQVIYRTEMPYLPRERDVLEFMCGGNHRVSCVRTSAPRPPSSFLAQPPLVFVIEFEPVFDIDQAATELLKALAEDGFTDPTED